MSHLATIIVVTHNSAQWRARQAAALTAQTDKRWDLVVIDNASAPSQQPSTTDFPSARIIQSETNLGFAGGNNRAAAGSETPYLVFLNPDAFPDPHWFAELISTAERYPDAASIGSTQLRDGSPDVLDGIGDVLHVSGIAYRAGHGTRANRPPLAETFSACGAAMLVRREAFEAVGGFDERYFCFFEDVDLCFRLRLAGWRILQSPDAVVAHVGGGSTGSKTAFAEFHGARNRLWTFVKCMPSALMWPLLPVHLITTALVAALGPIRGRGLYGWRGIVEGIHGLRPILQTRRELQKSRKIPALAVAGMLAWSPDLIFTRRAVHRKIRG